MLSRCRDWIVKKRKKGNCCRWSRCAPPEQASNEFIAMEAIQMAPEERRQSLPRRLLGRFLSERSINDEAEELKQLMIEHGLYNRHQTLEQRRRLKVLLNLEDRSLLADNNLQRVHFVLNSLECQCNAYRWLQYRESSIKDNDTRMQHMGSLPSLPSLPLTRVYAPRTTRSKSEPTVLQYPSVAPFQPRNQTSLPPTSLPYLETAV